MDFNHVYDLHRLLAGRRTPLPTAELLSRLEVTRSTFDRIRSFMVDCLNAPIRNQKGLGYYYDHKQTEQYELPGIWFSAEELMALSLLEELLESLQPVVVKSQLEPIRDKIQKLAEAQGVKSENLQKRLRILPQWQRPCDSELFVRISHALLQRKQLEIVHHNRQENSQLTRIISPQQLIYYRDNWYLDAWCHLRKGLRTFSIDAIQSAKKVELSAKEISGEVLINHYNTSYGIFAGEATAEATLDFSPRIAAWISNERWHPQQKERWTAAGNYRLTFPYNDPRELILDIMRYGAEVEVIAPESLREQVKEQLKEALGKYL